MMPARIILTVALLGALGIPEAVADCQIADAKLEEAILLQAEILDLKANPDRPGEGSIIEAKLERGRGPVATVLIKRGTLKLGDIFVAGSEWGRVRAMLDDMARAATEAGPSAPAEILGQPSRWDLILCGDVCYEAPMTARILPWLRRMAETTEVWLADPGRAYLPRSGLAAFARYAVPTTLELEDRTERAVTLYRLAPDESYRVTLVPG